MGKFSLAYEDEFENFDEPVDSATTVQDVDTGAPSVSSPILDNQSSEQLDLTPQQSKTFTLFSPEDSKEIDAQGIDMSDLRNVTIDTVRGFKDLFGQTLDDLSIYSKTDRTGLGSHKSWTWKVLKDRAKLSLTDSPQERDDSLNLIYGEDGWKKTQMGVVINPDGLFKAGYINERERDWRSNSKQPYVTLDGNNINMADFADMVGHAPELTTAVVAGVATQGMSLPFSIATVAGSTGFVKFAQEELEALKEFETFFGTKNIDSTISEEGVDADTVKMGKTAAKYAAAGEVGGRAIGWAGRKVLTGRNTQRASAVEESGGWPTITWEKLKDDPMGVVSELKRVAVALVKGKRGEVTSIVDPAKLELTKDAEKMGVTLPLSEAVGPRSNPLTQRAEALAENVHKNIRAKRQTKNVEAIEKKRQEFIDAEGGQTGKEADTLMAESVEGSLKESEKNIARLEEQATEKLETKVASKTDKPLEDYGSKIQSKLKGEAEKVNRQNRINYAKIDKLLPKGKDGLPKRQVGTASIRDALNKYLNETFQVKTTKIGQKTYTEFVGMPKEVKNLLDDVMKADNLQSFQSVHASRTRFRNLAYDPQFLKTVDDRFFRIIEKAHDDALRNAKLGNNPKAYEALSLADQYYKNTRPALDNKFIRNLLKDARQGGVEPSQVIGKIENASIEDVRKLFGDTKTVGLLDKVGQKEVRDGIVKNWLDKAGAISGVKEINGGLLLRQMEKLEKTGAFNTIFKQQHKQVKALLEQIDALNAPINMKGVKLDKLDETKFKTLLQDSIKATEARDKVMKKTFIKKLTDGDKSVVKYLFRKDMMGQIRKAKAHFGENSKEWVKFKQEAMEDLMGSMINHTENVGHIVFKGEPLLNKLIGSGSMEKEIIEIYGKQRHKELVRFAQVATAATRETTMSSGLIAGMLALHPFKNLSRIVGLHALAKFMNSPTGIRYMTEGIKRGKFANMTGHLLARITGQTIAPQVDEVRKSVGRGVDATLDFTISAGKAIGRETKKLVKNRTR